MTIMRTDDIRSNIITTGVTDFFYSQNVLYKCVLSVKY